MRCIDTVAQGGNHWRTMLKVTAQLALGDLTEQQEGTA